MLRRLCALMLITSAVLCACGRAQYCRAETPPAAANLPYTLARDPQTPAHGESFRRYNGASGPFSESPYPGTALIIRELDTDRGCIYAENGYETSEAGPLYTRTYRYPDGGIFVSERLVARGMDTDPTPVFDIALDGSSGTIRFHDGAAWRSEPLRAEELGQEMYFISTDRQDLIVCPPAAYRQLTNGVIEEIQAGIRFYIEKTARGWRVRTDASGIENGAFIDCTYLISNSRLIDWSDPGSERDWENFLLTGKNRWTYDGYYYKTPPSYSPTGDNCYHRLVSAYVTTKLIAAGGQYTAARELGLAMLDVMCLQQTSDGFFPTLARCAWLFDDYDIGPGFFDSRFNSDLALSMLGAVKDLGALFLCPTIDRYSEFFLSYVTDCGVGLPGSLLVPDYWHPDGSPTTHTSLNHQCAEALTLFKLYEYSHDARFYRLGMALVRGVCDKAGFWMSGEGGNLNYAWRDGSRFGSDYLCLTYNDLYKLQEELLVLRGSRDKTLQMMIDHKLEWMISNGVTGYLGEQPRT